MVQRLMNGIDTQELRHTMGEIENNPELAHFNFVARNQWVDGTHNRAIVEEFYEAGQRDTSRQKPMSFEEDEPPVLLGGNRGANPVEYVLIGLSGCLTTALVAHAAARGIKLKSVESHLEGDLDVRGFLGMPGAMRNGYENIRVHFRIESDASELEIDRLVRLAQERSPVFDIVTNKVPVSVDFEMKKKYEELRVNKARQLRELESENK